MFRMAYLVAVPQGQRRECIVDHPPIPLDWKERHSLTISHIHILFKLNKSHFPSLLFRFGGKSLSTSFSHIFAHVTYHGTINTLSNTLYECLELVELIFTTSSLHIQEHPIIILFHHLIQENERRRSSLGHLPSFRTTRLRNLGDLSYFGLISIRLDPFVTK